MKMKKVFMSIVFTAIFLVTGASATVFAYDLNEENLTDSEYESYEFEELTQDEEFKKSVKIKKYLEEKGFEVQYSEFKLDGLYFFDITGYNGNDEEVIIPNRILKIKDRAFENCKNIKKVQMPYVHEIGNYAFNGCTSLEEVFVSDINLSSIGNCAFMNCKSLKDFTVPQRIKIISKGAFLGCENLTNVTLNSELIEIREYAFTNCKNISSIVIPNKVSRIGSSAFMNCTNLEKVKITGDLKVNDGQYKYPGYISSLAFYNCKKLKEINFNPEVSYQYDSFPGGCVVNGEKVDSDAEENLESIKEEARSIRENMIKLLDKIEKDKIDWSQYNPPTGEFGNSDDGIARLLNLYDGYSSLPKVVDEDTFNKLSEEKSVLYRGIGDRNGKTGADFANEFRYGKFFNGQGFQGNGTYTTTDLKTAWGYAYEWGNGAQEEENIGLLKMFLDDSTKIIDYDYLCELAKAYKNDDIEYLVKIFEDEDKPQTYLMDYDLGNLAEVAGYDAIHYYDTDANFYIILNRGKVIVSDKNVDTSKMNFLSDDEI